MKGKGHCSHELASGTFQIVEAVLDVGDGKGNFFLIHNSRVRWGDVLRMMCRRSTTSETEAMAMARGMIQNSTIRQFVRIRQSQMVLPAADELIAVYYAFWVRAQASGGGEADVKVELRTCRSCKKMFNPLENHPLACRFHTAHYGGETKRKFESVYTGGTMDTAGGGEIVAYWHCCGAADAFDPGCEAAPHMSYDD